MSTYSVYIETSYPGDPSTWAEGADKPEVVTSGLTYEAAYAEKSRIEAAYADADYCDQCAYIGDGYGSVCLGDCRGIEHNVYVEVEPTDQDELLKLARAT